MKLSSTLAVLAFGALSMQSAQAGTFNLNLSLADGSRFYNYFSDVYAEVGSDWGVIDNELSEFYEQEADGYWSISNPGAKLGSGWVTFPMTVFTAGSVSYDDVTGAISGLTLEFGPYIADGSLEMSATGRYSTVVSGISGTVNLVDGQVAGISLDADIGFSFTSKLPSSTGTTAWVYNGSFSIDGDEFALNVDDRHVTLGSAPVPAIYRNLEVRYAWDVTGSVQGLTAPVPEPQTYAMMAAGLLAVAGMARRRRT